MSKEIIDTFDDLTLEETNKLTEDIDTIITIDEETKERIKERAFEEVGISNQKVARIHKRKGYKMWVKVAACIASVFVIGSVTVYASGMLEGLSDYFTGEVADYKDKISDTIQTASNKDYEIAIKGALLDENQFQFVFMVEGKSKKGKKIVSEVLATGNMFSPDEVYATLKDHSKKKVEHYSISRWSNDQVQNADNDRSGVAKIITDELGIDSMAEVEYFEFYCKGIKLTVDAVMTGETISLKAEKKTEIKDVELSPIGFSFIGKDIEIDEATEDVLLTGHKIRYIKKDGTLEEPQNESYDSWDMGDMVHVVADFGMVIQDLDEYKGIQIDGVNFYKTKN
ncbi:MAG: DUF4179 domain-containing protein [bacterium]|nr:DUF4179 domain-containing protein [bacterium]